MRKKETPNPSRVRGRGVEVSETLFYQCFLIIYATDFKICIVIVGTKARIII